MTANHVASAYEGLHVAWCKDDKGERFDYTPIDILGRVESADLALARTNVPHYFGLQPGQLPKSTGVRLPPLDTYTLPGSGVFTMGFPNISLNEYFWRHFKGPVVALRKTRRSEGRLSAGIWVYELQFVCPPGISGAPLMATTEVAQEDTRNMIVGIVIGESKTTTTDEVQGDRTVYLGTAVSIGHIRDEPTGVGEKIYKLAGV